MIALQRQWLSLEPRKLLQKRRHQKLLQKRRHRKLLQKRHQSLLESLSSQPSRAPIVLSGDLHAIGHATLLRSSDLDLSANPVHALLTGPIALTKSPSEPSVVLYAIFRTKRCTLPGFAIAPEAIATRWRVCRTRALQRGFRSGHSLN